MKENGIELQHLLKVIAEGNSTLRPMKTAIEKERGGKGIDFLSVSRTRDEAMAMGYVVRTGYDHTLTPQGVELLAELEADNEKIAA